MYPLHHQNHRFLDPRGVHLVYVLIKNCRLFVKTYRYVPGQSLKHDSSKSKPEKATLQFAIWRILFDDLTYLPWRNFTLLNRIACNGLFARQSKGSLAQQTKSLFVRQSMACSRGKAKAFSRGTTELSRNLPPLAVYPSTSFFTFSSASNIMSSFVLP